MIVQLTSTQSTNLNSHENKLFKPKMATLEEVKFFYVSEKPAKLVPGGIYFVLGEMVNSSSPANKIYRAKSETEWELFAVSTGGGGGSVDPGYGIYLDTFGKINSYKGCIWNERFSTYIWDKDNPHNDF